MLLTPFKFYFRFILFYYFTGVSVHQGSEEIMDAHMGARNQTQFLCKKQQVKKIESILFPNN